MRAHLVSGASWEQGLPQLRAQLQAPLKPPRAETCPGPALLHPRHLRVPKAVKLVNQKKLGCKSVKDVSDLAPADPAAAMALALV